jgi:hypothetical protein
MKLKPIEENMVVHCKTEDEAKELIKWAYECGYYNNTLNINVCYLRCGENVCYYFCDAAITYDNIQYFRSHKDYSTPIEFSDLIIPEEPQYQKHVSKFDFDDEEQEEHMSAEEILEWIKTNFTNMDAYTEVFGHLCTYSSIFTDFTAKEVVSKIEAYEAKKKQEKEVEVEWVYRVFNYKENKDEFYHSQLDASHRCEEIVKKNPNVYAKYEYVCRAKTE